ncbi:precorrin-2 dehydrogenase/sirohydrochlorin ferrochelatase family protein [Tenacibaculum finnmarkense]|uniref:precorrin-2 dehydrogenase n=1 Tax=Tenacibaculum finnmarkense genomovar finnmarkense TaxID=1458503 RepID=A0AAP1WFW3_9FLAO|nr:bifunctional precorrin-2 dehydrogenase/sirohydrochlorin ferrochelatase [Tenacibaculum finnmarkense]MBE7652443.1 bifunctional precorrin-2 dehydrogenase/sirohydrochlorin ferrochelatase [Tenacibaculum finnmarkense genomovar finnmarkense]MBE7694747.1 bifunctional precorrin-2 dehydrogenase/sirohydrochlorin ferrochelatase [Tenacibaculum finnmarkense genomovar finnmarkense]MCD8427087.1 bifunctional precorrin-2 dehydrogenase/sirohydrochlorin ferrochelatase [Tenacibaculum finnmarkense genomovar finnma
MIGKQRNNLYPVFLKMEQLNVLIVGGGNVALEKLTFLLKSSPNAKVKMVAPFFREETMALASKFSIEMIVDIYHEKYLSNKQMVIATTDKEVVNIAVYKDCKQQNILANVADNPPYCDFYMGGIVTKGNVKIAISTNGKSPTTAKRLRQFLEEVIPENIDDLVQNLNKYRKMLKGDFEQKVRTLNLFTRSLVE